MRVPQVAIVGRPNVGKSSLMNWLAKKRISVVDPMAGVTRDRVTYLMHDEDRYFELVDTGGMGIEDPDDLTADVEHQISNALGEADLILFVVDGVAGPVPLDHLVAERLRKVETPKVLVINKCDSERTDAEAPLFMGLAPHAPVVVTSVKGNRNRERLLRQIIEQLPPAAADEGTTGKELSAEPELKLAIVGRRNVGKSTFINALAEEERMIVSEVAGTTRDSVDIRFAMDGKSFVAIDTPGVRKKKSLANDVEWYGLARANRSIRRANVVLMFFDAVERISRVDKKLVAEISEHHKPCIFVINKWDLHGNMTMPEWTTYLEKMFPTMRHTPYAFITAQTGKNSKKLINLAQSMFKQSRQRVSTGQLNRLITQAVDYNAPAYRKNRRPKIFYATQVGTEPPTIVLKVNDASLFDVSWKRFLLGVFREHLPFKEVPIKVYYRSREEGDKSSPTAHPVRTVEVDDGLPDDDDEFEMD